MQRHIEGKLAWKYYRCLHTCYKNQCILILKVWNNMSPGDTRSFDMPETNVGCDELKLVEDAIYVWCTYYMSVPELISEDCYAANNWDNIPFAIWQSESRYWVYNTIISYCMISAVCTELIPLSVSIY